MHIIEDEQLGKYRLLTIDGEPPIRYSHYRINGVIYKPVPTHNLKPQYIAIEDDLSHIGQEIEFVLMTE